MGLGMMSSFALIGLLLGSAGECRKMAGMVALAPRTD